jgi:hypothetical protein
MHIYLIYSCACIHSSLDIHARTETCTLSHTPGRWGVLVHVSVPASLSDMPSAALEESLRAESQLLRCASVC